MERVFDVHCSTALYVLFLIFATASAQQQCRDEVECSARGVCMDETNNGTWYCLCDDGWTTYPVPDRDSTATDPIYCNYEQKKQLVAFILSFCLGYCAAGRFYVGQYVTAGFKIAMCVGLGICGVCCVACICGALQDESTAKASVWCYVCFIKLAIAAWLIADWILFALNQIPDENGVKLEAW